MSINLSSGQPPYEYVVPLPVKSSKANGEKIGLSGIFIEQGQFVIKSEIVKFELTNPAIFNPYALWINPFDPPQFYEPDPEGRNLGGVNYGPALITIDNFLQSRQPFETLLNAYAVDSDYNVSDHQADWFGTLQGDTTATDHFRVEPPSTGELIDSDIAILGGSGVFFDIDVQEIMFNPFPYIREYRANFDPHGSNSRWKPSLVASPFYPSFQKTDGDLVALNGRENNIPEDPPTDVEDLYAAHVGSGAIRLDGYVLRDQTEFFASTTRFFDDSATDFSYLAGGARKPNGVSKAVGSTRQYLTTQALPTGLYRVAAKNPRSTYVHTVVESGVVSQFPQLNNIYDEGYEVFNEAWFLTDYGVRDITTGAGTIQDSVQNASGVVLYSPFTYRGLWQRNAQSTGGPPVVRHIARVSKFSHIAHEGVVASYSTPSFTANFDIDVTDYDNVLDINSQFTITGQHNFAAFSSPNARPPRFYHYDDTLGNHWFVGSRGGLGPIGTPFASLIFYRWDSSFNFISAYTAPNTPNGTNDINQMFCDNNTFLLVASANGNILKYDFNGATFSFISNKPTDIGSVSNLAFGSSSAFEVIEDAVYIANSPYVNSGWWFLISNRNGGFFFTARGLTLVRMVENATEWNVAEAVVLSEDIGLNNVPSTLDIDGLDRWSIFFGDSI